jgi:hypothetical protein
VSDPEDISLVVQKALPLIQVRNGMAVSQGVSCLTSAERGAFFFEVPTFDVRIELRPQLGSAGFAIHLEGPASLSGRLQRAVSPDAWMDWRQVTLGSGPLEIVDDDVAETRLYRFVSP